MPKKLKIDFVSDVSCPWCAVGLGGLEMAMERVKGEVSVDLVFQPYELNPNMVAEGQDAVEYLAQKYGSTEAQQIDMRKNIQARGEEVGFEFNPAGRGRIWNTFDAHRLLYLAETEGEAGQQLALKKAMLSACHSDQTEMANHTELTALALQCGLDEHRVKAVLGSDEFTDEVRERQQFYSSRGISSVPAVVINDKHLISGGQPAEAFEQALRQIAAQEA